MAKKIVINNAIIAYRKQKKTLFSPMESEHYRLFSPTDDTLFEDQQSAKEKASLLIATIATLNENYAQSLNLHLLEGLTHEEVAELLNISAANCRTTYSRAKEQLRNKLEANPLWKNL